MASNMKNDDDHHHEHTSALQSQGVEFLISGENKVPVLSSWIEGKMVWLFFSANWSKPCMNFMPHLLQLYNNLNKQMEIIFVSFDRDEPAFMDSFKNMPWLAVPFMNTHARRWLCSQYHIKQIPSLVPLSKIITTTTTGSEEEDVVQLIKDYGADAFPFDGHIKTRSIDQLKAMDESKREEGRLQDLLGSKQRNYLISKDDSKVAISELVGKTIGLYFGAHWCPPCREFTSFHLMEAYNELMVSRQAKFEIVFISSDKDEDGYKRSWREMACLAVPYHERSRHDLSRIYQVKMIPSLIILGPHGKVVSTDGRAAVTRYGAMAFPFTATRIAELEMAIRKEREGLVPEMKDWRHEHVLKLDMAMAYVCDGCGRRGRHCAFSCFQCDFDLHPTCVQENKTSPKSKNLISNE